MHGARGLKVDRKSGDRTTIYIPHAAVCVSGTIQPDTLRRALLPEFFENGLAARLLVNMPEPRAKRWTEHEITDATQAAVNGLFDRLFDLRLAPSPDGNEPALIDLSEDARAIWIDFVNEHNQKTHDLHGHARSAWAKLEGYAARFALVRHCVREVDGQQQSIYVDAPTRPIFLSPGAPTPTQPAKGPEILKFRRRRHPLSAETQMNGTHDSYRPYLRPVAVARLHHPSSRAIQSACAGEGLVRRH